MRRRSRALNFFDDTITPQADGATDTIDTAEVVVEIEDTETTHPSQILQVPNKRRRSRMRPCTPDDVSQLRIRIPPEKVWAEEREDEDMQ